MNSKLAWSVGGIIRRDERVAGLFESHHSRISRPTNFKILKFGFRGGLPRAVLNVARCSVALCVGWLIPSLGPCSTWVCAPASLHHDRRGVLWIDTNHGRPTPVVGVWLDQVCL